MPDVSTDDSPGDTVGAVDHRGLTLLPFRGVRYVEARVSDLAEVTSPPYDVLDADGVLALESADSHNVVRLILPRDDDCGPEGRYEHAASTLRRWLDEGVLTVDKEAGLYVYEQASDQAVAQRGLLGNVSLRDPAERVVLPHEDVMPGPVADRLELMRAARANFEPILLMYDGESGPTAEVVARVAAAPATVTAHTHDGLTHRLWQVTDPKDLATVAADLAGRQALIADGHHRYAAYRALQSELEVAGGSGPWDSGLALLVDLRAHPPQVGAIHRALSALTLEAALHGLTELFDVTRETVTDPEAAARGLATGELLLVAPDGSAARLVVRHDAAVEEIIGRDHPVQWRGLDTAVLHQVLVEQVWDLAEDRVSYHHEVAGAMRAAARSDGTAVLLAPIAVEFVLELAAEGVRMPRKSTSFGPKPRTGLVLRTFEAG
jgi:uncharacterized protein (DUF1015 family)